MFFGVFEAEFMGSKISKTAEVFAVCNMWESTKPATTERKSASVPVPEAGSAAAPSEAAGRTQWFARWTTRALELTAARGPLERRTLRTCASHFGAQANSTLTWVWQTNFLEALVGEVPDCGVFEQKFKHADMSVGAIGIP